MIKAAKKGNLELVNSLLENGIDVNSRDENGWTPLMWASCKRHVKLISTLLEKGADINAKDKEGHTALIIALLQNSQGGWNGNNLHIEIIKLLLEKGAEVNTKDNKGRTSLIIASTYASVNYNDYIELIKFLLEKGANLNDKDNRGLTALIIALDRGWVEIVKILMEAGALIDDQNKDEVQTLVNGHVLPLPEAQPPFPEFAKKHDLSIVVEVEKDWTELQISANRCTINWGDDSSTDEYNKHIKGKNISHRYPKSGSYTITINAEGLSRFKCNNATAIYLNNCPQLEWLTCYHNKLTYLDVSRCTALTTLYCDNNKLKSLDLSNNLELDYLSCDNNLLTCLDISNNMKLWSVSCSHNQLSILNVNSNGQIQELRRLFCNDNLLDKQELNRLFNLLPIHLSSKIEVKTWSGPKSIANVFCACGRNPGFDSCNKDIAKNKKWLVWIEATYIAATTAGTPAEYVEKRW